MKNRTEEDETRKYGVAESNGRQATQKKLYIGNEWRLLKWHAGHGIGSWMCGKASHHRRFYANWLQSNSRLPLARRACSTL